MATKKATVAPLKFVVHLTPETVRILAERFLMKHLADELSDSVGDILRDQQDNLGVASLLMRRLDASTIERTCETALRHVQEARHFPSLLREAVDSIGRWEVESRIDTALRKELVQQVDTPGFAGSLRKYLLDDQLAYIPEASVVSWLTQKGYTVSSKKKQRDHEMT